MLTLAEIQIGMSRLNEWSLDGQSVTKEWEFKHFRESVAFLNKVSETAEKNNHYPTVFLDKTRVRLILTTEYERALSEKDFQLAEELDKIST